MSNDTTQEEVLFFGCFDEAGHYLRHPNGRCEWGSVEPWGTSLDGGLLVGVLPDVPDGRFTVNYKNGWTAVSFWDRSGDSRPNSNSTFLTHEEVSGEILIARAAEQWPQLFKRVGFPLRLKERA